MSPSRAAVRRAFTLFELMVVVTLMAIVASAVLPMAMKDTTLRLTAAALVLRSDIELAQVMSISYPSDPVIVVFDLDNEKYWLAFAESPETPLPRSDTGEPYEVVLGEGRASSALGVHVSIENLADDSIAFDAQGALVDFTTTPMITLSLDGEWITLTISPMTGTINETSG
jgi:prepilin-type N-terminal cleavage/methylation domain-containing protein